MADLSPVLDDPRPAQSLGAETAMHGVARIGFAAEGSRTRLSTLYQRAPLRVLFPSAPAGDAPHAVLVTTSGGLVGGDLLEVEVEVGRNARALVTTQAAEKVYRSTGRDARFEVSLRAGAHGWLEWMPQETILFERARLRRRTSLHLDAEARALAGEILVFGRHAHGERLRHGLLRDVWEVRVGDRLVWADALRLDDDLTAQLSAPFGFAGASAAAMLIYAGADAASWRDPMRAMLDTGDGLRAGVTCLPGLVIARFLGHDAAHLRAAFAGLWTSLRHAAADLPRSTPVPWG